MKQRELGELVGFTDGAANRIAQYESGFRVPKEDMVKKIADALHVKECALLEPDTGNLEGIKDPMGQSPLCHHQQRQHRLRCGGQLR